MDKLGIVDKPKTEKYIKENTLWWWFGYFLLFYNSFSFIYFF